MINQNYQAFEDFIGIENIAGATLKDKKEYISGVVNENISQTYAALKTQQTLNAIAANLQVTNGDRIKPVKPAKRERIKI